MTSLQTAHGQPQSHPPHHQQQLDTTLLGVEGPSRSVITISARFGAAGVSVSSGCSPAHLSAAAPGWSRSLLTATHLHVSIDVTFTTREPDRGPPAPSTRHPVLSAVPGWRQESAPTAPRVDMRAATAGSTFFWYQVLAPKKLEGGAAERFRREFFTLPFRPRGCLCFFLNLPCLKVPIQ